MSDRVWKHHELQTLLALMAKGVHIQGRGKKRTTDPAQLRHAARMDFVTAVNEALSKGKHNYDNDISVRDILDKLDELLVERKHVVGPGGLMERSSRGKLTRSLTFAFRRNRDMDFDGSIDEWKAGRRLVEVNKYRLKKGMVPLPEAAFDTNDNPSVVSIRAPPITIYRKPESRDPGTSGSAYTPASYRNRRDAPF